MGTMIVPRHACPTLVQPMQTGDGYLARLPPLLAPLSPRQLAGIAEAAIAHGNGLVEISQRGNFQIRGLGEEGGPALAATLAALDLDLPGGPPISVDPLLDIAETFRAREFADRLRHRLDGSGLAPRLAPKIALVLDFGTRFAPNGLSADIRIAFRADRAHLGVGGDAEHARWLGSVPAPAAVEAVFALLERLAEIGPYAQLAGSSADVDASDFEPTLGGLPEFVAGPGGPPLDGFASEGEQPFLDGTPVAAISFAFGQTGAEDLGRLAETARLAGITAIAPASDRRLLFAGQAAALVSDEAARLGFVTEPGDPRHFLFACAGSAGCASGSLATREIAAEVAIGAARLLDGSFSLHLSGCAKGCAHPQATALALTAIDKSLAVVLEGRPRDAAAGIVPAKDIAMRLAALAEVIASQGGTMAAGLERLDATRVAAILGAAAGREEGRRDGSGSGQRDDRLSA